MTRIAWPPKVTPTKVRGKTNIRRDGERLVIKLMRWGNDRTLSGDEHVQCCDCGLRHLHTYNVMTTPDKNWYLLHRAYRLNSGKMRCHRKHVRGKK